MSGAMLNAHFLKLKEELQQTPDEDQHDSPDTQPQEDNVLNLDPSLEQGDLSDFDPNWNADDILDEYVNTSVTLDPATFTLKKEVSAPPSDTLQATYADMVDKSREICLYPLDPQISKSIDDEAVKLEAELCSLIGVAFDHVLAYVPGRDPRDSNTLIAEVADKTRYRVTQVERVQNLAQFEMFTQFGKSHSIRQKQTAFHGTKMVHAKSIQRIGFKGAASRRCKFGKGIYMTKSIFEALAYAEPDHEDNQVVMVGEVWMGRTKLGTEGQVCVFHPLVLLLDLLLSSLLLILSDLVS